MRSFESVQFLSLRAAAICVVAASVPVVGAMGCAAQASEDTAETSNALHSHASEAGLYDWSVDARGVLAVVNDRWLSVDDYVFRVRISRVTAEAIIAARNGTNGTNESRPAGWWGGGSSSSSSGGSSGTSGPTTGSPSSGADGGTGPWPVPPYPQPCTWPSPPPPGPGSSSGGSSGSSGPSFDGGPPPPHPPYPPSYPCHPSWQLGGDDEQFTWLSEVDAMPGSDVSAFHNLRSYAYANGYVSYTPPPPIDGGGPFPTFDGGSPWPTFDAGPRP
jgi:hypothetical protein